MPFTIPYSLFPIPDSSSAIPLSVNAFIFNQQALIILDTNTAGANYGHKHKYYGTESEKTVGVWFPNPIFAVVWRPNPVIPSALTKLEVRSQESVLRS